MRRGINGEDCSNLRRTMSYRQQNVNAMTRNNQRHPPRNTNTTATYNIEEMINHIRQNPNVALSIHHYLTQAQVEASTPQTPKRNLDSSDSEGVHVNKQQRVLSNGNSKEIDQENPQQSNSEQLHHRIPFEQLKRAVSSNRPCFLIEYDQTASSKNCPSDISAANSIEEHFNQQGIPVSFSLVGHAGNKLKLGVNNKETYAMLLCTEKWPSQISNINITVIKPKVVPDAFALVVRYVPLQYGDEFVKNEIERNLRSAENVRRIQYRFQRRTNDFRFTVTDLKEYNSTLKLGRMSIGNSFCTITPFLTGNRMTYCTRCWCLGHTREKCQLRTPRCRICLSDLTEGLNHNCTNIPRCAQCGNNHHSLSSDCEKVVMYRSELKEQVNQALSTGKLYRLQPQEQAQINQFQMKHSEFPSLPQPLIPRAIVWNRTTTQSGMESNESMSGDTTKILMSINRNVLDMKENVHAINEQLNQMNEQVNQTTRNIELHHETLNSIMSFLSSLVIEYVGPTTAPDRRPQLQQLYDGFKMKRLHFESEYNNRRTLNVSPPPHLSPSRPPEVNKKTASNEVIENMNG